MTNPERHIKLSIVIPTYNGEEFLSETLENIISQRMSDKIEVVLCDDRSTDMTIEIARSFCREHPNIRLYENRDNLGMDRNFEQVVTHATGEYIWFCGQDDVIGDGAVEKVLAALDQDSTIDFIYMNYGQYTHDLKRAIKKKMLKINEDVLCNDPRSFFDVIVDTTCLPSFLPAFILRKALWHSVDKSPFYGTQFVQVGVFLALLNNLRSYIIAYPYVKGRIPDTGWQQNRLTVLDIFTGFLEVVHYYFTKAPGLISKDLYRKQLIFTWKNVLYNIYLLKLRRIPLNDKINARMKRIFGPQRMMIINLLLLLPHGIVSLLNPVITRMVDRYKKGREDVAVHRITEN